MISILDYGAGNLKSVQNAFNQIGCPFHVITSAEEINQASILVFPGVGHFGQVMDHLHTKGLRQNLIQYIQSGKKYLGICIGMQILFASSEESIGKPGLGIYHTVIQKFTHGKVPQIGWNHVPACPPLVQDEYYYFVNSFYVPQTGELQKTNHSVSTYHTGFLSFFQDKNIVACQFHPEKSGETGISFLKKWANNVN